MQFLKTFGLLLLLTLGNTGIAFSYDNLPAQNPENQVDFQVSEDQVNLFESTLIVPAEILTSRILVPVGLIPPHLYSRRISRANSYFVYSRTIIPSLDITAIIFPFHSFL